MTTAQAPSPQSKMKKIQAFLNGSPNSSTTPNNSPGTSGSGNSNPTNQELTKITGMADPTQPLADDDAKKIIAWVKSQYQKMKGARMTQQRQWYMNYMMYGARQYSTIGQRYGIPEIATPRAAPWRVRQTVNLIRPMIRTEVARLTSQKPTVTAIPATTSDDDLFAAQAAEQLWQWMTYIHDFQKIMQRNAFWTSIAGTSFIKTWWDNDYKDNYTQLSGTGQPAIGDVCFGQISPFNIFVPDLLEPEVEDQPYVFEAYTRSVTWVKQFWGIDVSANVVSRNEIVEATYFNIPGGNDTKPDAVLCIEAWCKPGGSEAYPEGGLFTLVGDKLFQGSFYSHQQFPYTKFEHIPTGKFYGDSVLVDINPLQRGYNRIKSQVSESINRTARPQFLAPQGSVDPAKVTAEPGLIILYKPSLGPIQPLPMQSIPQYVMEEMDRAKADMEDISGQHSVTRGQVPGSGITAATAISFLQEQDDGILGTTYASIESGVEKVARQALCLAVDYYDLPRSISIVGLDESFDVLELKGSDIKNGKNVRVEAGSSLPESRSARQAFLMDLVKLGVITGDQMLDMLDMGGVQKLTERVRRDLRQAQRENLKMKRLSDQEYQQFEQEIAQAAAAGAPGTVDPQSGMPLMDPALPGTFPPMVPVNEWDNHQVHIDTHNDFRKSQEFEFLPPFIKDQFQKHVQAHMLALQGQAIPQAGQAGPAMAMSNQQDAQQASNPAAPGAGPNPSGGAPNLNSPSSNSGPLPPNQSPQGPPA
jgi:hypothetical protein